jgi:tol-pal system protein YbgF
MKYALLLIALVVATVYGCANLQQDVNSLYYRVSLLEQRNNDLEKKLSATEKERKALLENLDTNRSTILEQRAMGGAQLDEIRSQIQALSGRLDETNHLVNQRLKEAVGSGAKADDQLVALQAQVKSNEQRIMRLEEYLHLEPTQKAAAAPAASGPQQSAPTIDTSENGLYAAAKAEFDKENFETALTQFNELIKRYPKTARAGNAQFWIGEIYYREKWYEKAILEYQKVIEKYPTGNKVAASMLKQGFSFLNIGDRTNTRLIFNQLIKKFPQSPEAGIARDKLKTLK